VALVGRVLKQVTADGAEDEVSPSAEAYAEALAERFGIRLPQAKDLWPRIAGRHEELFGTSATPPATRR
jgi:hypothetical protein